MVRVNEIMRQEENRHMEERTLAIIKPDGVSRRLIGAVLSRLEQERLQIAALKMIRMTKEQAKGFYKVHKGKPFFESVTDFMSSGACVVMILKGDDVIRRYRKVMGATNPTEAEEGTIRRQYATDIEKNVVHGSDSAENAQFEINYFFNALEVTAS
jgi:nucleoside-diphosphate kinase